MGAVLSLHGCMWNGIIIYGYLFFLHAFMNLACLIFAMDETALRGMLPNIFRGLTITIAIVFTIFYWKKQSRKPAITFNNLFIKREEIRMQIVSIASFQSFFDVLKNRLSDIAITL